MNTFRKSLWALVLLLGMVACSTEHIDPKPANPIVGDWVLGRIRFSGFKPPYDLENGDLDPSQYGISETWRFYTDSTFSATQRSGDITDYAGKWKLSSDEVHLMYQAGFEDKLVLNRSKDITQLVSGHYQEKDTLINPVTKQPEVVAYQVQFVYEKK